VDVLIRVHDDASPVEDLDGDVRVLRADLLALDVDDVVPASRGEVPLGARAVDAETVGALIVASRDSAELLGRVVSAVRRWLERGSPTQQVEISLGDRTLRLSAATSAQQSELIEAFLSAAEKG
jgi:hypothetical protein